MAPAVDPAAGTRRREPLQLHHDPRQLGFKFTSATGHGLCRCLHMVVAVRM